MTGIKQNKLPITFPDGFKLLFKKHLINYHICNSLCQCKKTRSILKQYKNNSFIEICTEKTGVLVYLCQINFIYAKIFVKRKNSSHVLIFDNLTLLYTDYILDKQYGQSTNQTRLAFFPIYCIVSGDGLMLNVSFFEPKFHYVWKKSLNKKKCWETCSIISIIKDLKIALQKTHCTKLFNFNTLKQNINSIHTISELTTFLVNSGLHEYVNINLFVCLHKFESIKLIKNNFNSPSLLYFVFPNDKATNLLQKFSIAKYKKEQVFFSHVSVDNQRGVDNAKILCLTKQNHKTSVSLTPKGFMLAYYLGFFSSWSNCNIFMKKFFKCTAVMRLKHSLKKTILIEYKDQFVCQQFTLVLRLQTDWITLVTFLLDRQSALQNEKFNLCKDLIQFLQLKNKAGGNLFLKCLKFINQRCNQLTIWLYDSLEGVFLNHLKTNLVKHLSKNTLIIETNKENHILGLKHTMFHFKNILGLLTNKICNKQSQLHKFIVSICKDFNIKVFRNKISIENFDTLCHKFFSFILDNHKVDIYSGNFNTLASLSYYITWFEYLQTFDPYTFLFMPIEKVSDTTEHYLRSVSKGGFSFSAKKTFHCNEQLSENLVSKSIYNFDINSSYGYSSTQACMPGGFGISYIEGTKINSKQRHKTFEFRAVFYTLYRLYFESDCNIRSVYSNFSPLGLFYIKKYPIDLTVILENGSILFFQMDGQFCHGCQNCHKPSSQYAGKKSLLEVMNQTKQRDSTILSWIENSHTKAELHIIKDCCDSFNNVFLKNEFLLNRHLLYLTRGYDDLFTHDPNYCPNDLTFLAIADVSCLCDSMQKYGPIFNWDNNVQTFSCVGQKILLTKDLYLYLKRICHNVTILKLYWIIFYQIDTHWSKTYQKLLKLKHKQCNNQSIKSFYKTVINLSCGFFGSKISSREIIKQTNHLPKLFQTHSDFHQISNISQDNFLSKRKKANRQQTKTTSLPLPLFCTIIEYGKLTLNKTIYKLCKMLPLDTFEIVYIHIDSIVLISNVSNFLSSIKSVRLANMFHSSCPGKLKLEWFMSEDQDDAWQFCTPNTMTYACCTSDNQLYKAIGVTKLDMETIFQHLQNKQSSNNNDNLTLQRPLLM